MKTASQTVTAESEPADSNDAFRPSSPWWGSMLCPVAAVVGRIQIQARTQEIEERDSMNIADAEIGKTVRDKDGNAWAIVGLDCEGLPRKKGPLVVICGPRGIGHRHLNQQEFAEFVRVADGEGNG